ncbi:MAG: thiamine diphosphokinase [Microthrixaceae bacterium]|nr:thiamine diphosphokinase [Microthrixaceae bacterium]
MPAVPAGPTIRIAADGGLDLAVALGEEVDLIVGDLDSVDGDLLADARRRGVEVRAQPVDKDLTDLELAIEAALTPAGPDRTNGASVPSASTELLVVGGGGGRLDHLLGVLAALASAARRGARVTAHLGDDVMWLVGPGERLELATRPGTTISLLAVGAPAVVRRAAGLRWPLDAATLSPDSALGLSNRAVAPAVTVEVLDGVVAVIAPEAPTDPEGSTPAAAGRFRRVAPDRHPQPGATA